MVASRSRPKGAGLAPFGLAAFALALTPADIGRQDLQPPTAQAPTAQALDAPPPAAERARAAMIASPFGTIHAATFSFRRPLGTAIPEPPRIQLASLDVAGLDITGATGERAVRGRRETPAVAPLVFPTVDRTLKGEFMAARPQPEAPFDGAAAAPSASASPADDEIEAAARFVPFPEYDISMSLELNPRLPADETTEPAAEADAAQPD